MRIRRKVFSNTEADCRVAKIVTSVTCAGSGGTFLSLGGRQAWQAAATQQRGTRPVRAHFLLLQSQLQSDQTRAADVAATGCLDVWGSIKVISGRSTRRGSRVRFSGHQPVTNPLLLLLLRCLQVISCDVEVRACAALYLMLPGSRRVGAPEAPGSGQLYSTCQIGALQWVETALRACPA
jgi:hypothetical protein